MIDIFFFSQKVIQISDLSNGLGWPVPTLAICLVISWICIFLSVVKGIKSSGKLSYVFAILPYVILILILIRACTLDGAMTGIKFFLYPAEDNWKKLLDLNVWYEALTQCFFSLTIGMGSIVMFSSYNEFDRNIHK